MEDQNLDTTYLCQETYFYIIFLQKGGTRGVKKVCFFYILANTSQKYSKIRYYVNYNKKLTIFQKLPSRIYDPRFFKKKHTFFTIEFYIRLQYCDFQAFNISFSRSITSGGHLRLIIAKMTRSTPKVIFPKIYSPNLTIQ